MKLAMQELKIEIPNGFMNVGVSNENFLYADTNDSKNWDTLKFPLPNGKWTIKSINGKSIILQPNL